MSSRELLEADALVESALARIGMDGMDERDPLAVIYQFKWRVRVLAGGITQGFTNDKKREVGLSFLGSEQAINKDAAHEAGHVVQYRMRARTPHCEDFTDAVGRAIVIGRAGMLRRLNRLPTTAAVVDSYAHLLPAEEVARRLWEVRRAIMRRMTGLIVLFLVGSIAQSLDDPF